MKKFIAHGTRDIRLLSGYVYKFHMPLFFMLSGAVLALKALKDFDSFMKSKIIRLLIPYFVCGLGFMLPVEQDSCYIHDKYCAWRTF